MSNQTAKQLLDFLTKQSQDMAKLLEQAKQPTT